MNKDLQSLYRARDTLRKYASVEQYNNELMATARAKRSLIEEASARLVKEKENKCKMLGFSHRFITRFVPIVALTLAVLAVFLFLSQTVLSDYISLDFASFVDDAREYAVENVSDFPTLLMNGNLKRYSEAERIAYFQSESFEADCYTFLIGSLIWMTIGFGLICAFIDKCQVSPVAFLFDVIVILVMSVTLLVQIKDLLGVLIGILWMSITGIPMMWACGVPIMIAFFVTNAILTVGFSVYDHAADKHKKNIAPNLAQIKSLKAEIAAEKADCSAKCAKINKPYMDALRPYPAEFNQLRIFLRDYNTVSQLIWAIENGYAKDIEGARVFLDQKAENAAIRKQLSQIQAETSRTYEAAIRAEAAALRAEAAASAPIDVTVTIR